MQQYRLKSSVFYHHIDAPLLTLIQPPYASKEACQLHFIRIQQNSFICKETNALQYIDTALPTALGDACFQLRDHETITLSKLQASSNKLHHAYSCLALILNLKNWNPFGATMIRGASFLNILLTFFPQTCSSRQSCTSVAMKQPHLHMRLPLL